LKAARAPVGRSIRVSEGMSGSTVAID